MQIEASRQAGVWDRIMDDWLPVMTRRVAQYSTEAQLQRPDLLQPYLYRASNLIERFFNKINQCRRVAPRYDKFEANYLAFLKLASNTHLLRADESPP